MALVWLALAGSVAALATAATVATVRGLELFRLARGLSAVAGSEVASIERKTRAIEDHLTAASRSGDALREEAERLAVSRARLNVLLAAYADARAALARVTVVLPRQ